MKDTGTGSTTMDSNMLIGPPKCDYIKSEDFLDFYIQYNTLKKIIITCIDKVNPINQTN